MNAAGSDSPRVSVLMAVRNEEAGVEASVCSILDQDFDDLEMIVINDGSTDRTSQILSRLASQDDRLSIVEQKNAGLTKSLNRALELARGEYIARQDGDDVSHPERLARQVDILDKRPDVVLVGSNSIDEEDNGRVSEWGWQDDEQLARTVFRNTPFPHSSAMMRANIAKQLGGYDESYETSQDMEFWMRLAKKGQVSMVREPLITRAVRKDAISQKRFLRQVKDAARARMSHTGDGTMVAFYDTVRHLVLSLMPRSLVLFLRARLR